MCTFLNIFNMLKLIIMITLSQNSIQKILGINEKVYLTKEDMSKQFIVTFSPYSDNKSLNINKFEKKLRESFSRLNIKVVPYDDSWVDVPLKKRINRFSKYLFNNVIWYIRKITGMSEINFYLLKQHYFRLLLLLKRDIFSFLMV